MEIFRHADIQKDLKNLRRFPAPLESLEAWERLFGLKGLGETPAINLFPGFGERMVYKGRVVPLKENVGKSRWYRVIFEVIEGRSCHILVLSRHGVYRSEHELIKLVRKRFGL